VSVVAQQPEGEGLGHGFLTAKYPRNTRKMKKYLASKESTAEEPMAEMRA
jgi:hypothetical protein